MLDMVVMSKKSAIDAVGRQWACCLLQCLSSLTLLSAADATLLNTAFQIWQETSCVWCHRHAQHLQYRDGFRSVLASFHCASFLKWHGSDCILRRCVCTRFVLVSFSEHCDLYPLIALVACSFATVLLL